MLRAPSWEATDEFCVRAHALLRVHQHPLDKGYVTVNC